MATALGSIWIPRWFWSELDRGAEDRGETAGLALADAVAGNCHDCLRITILDQP